MRRGWLERLLAHTRIFIEERDKAMKEVEKKVKRRCQIWDRKHPLGEEEPETPFWSID